MPYTAEQAAELLRALEGRWKPVYQEVDGQMIQPAISAATMLELQSDQFKVEKNGAVAYESVFIAADMLLTHASHPDPFEANGMPPTYDSMH